MKVRALFRRFNKEVTVIKLEEKTAFALGSGEPFKYEELTFKRL